MSSLDETLQARVRRVHERISAAARAAGRDPASIGLVAVSKTYGPDLVLAATRARLRRFAENYVQEGVEKIARVREAAPDLVLEWHFIGPLQANKTRPVAESFDWVQSIERTRVAQRLAEQRPAGLPPLNVLLQVNISGEETKSGVPPAEVAALAAAVAALPRLRLRGLMAIPAPASAPAEQRRPFARLRQLLESLRAHGHDLDTLSMGMSEDLEAAILEGATMVRIGAAIFGARGP
ncbi:MAG TPA: YggS family pyridoxal phosphate-dependent enzyme [Burkholderiaceae bacterium]|nr:YggS family pyridoxal phosphate-dependent enzyme [Burkholderiaceae bacterium]